MAGEWPMHSLRDAGVKLIDCDHRTPPASEVGYPYVAIPQLRGGRIDLLDAGNEDFALRTVPRVGALLSFDLYGQPNKTSILLQSLAEAPTPTVFPGVGTLYIRRNSMVFLPHGTTDGTGFATGTLQLGSSPALIGTSLYYQGYTVGPRKLTGDWVKATILP